MNANGSGVGLGKRDRIHARKEKNTIESSALLFLAIILILIGVLGFAILPYLSSLVDSPESLDRNETYSSLGEQIFFSGRGENDRPISYSYGPQWLRMMGGSCSSCHGEEGTGGFQIMMSDEEAPSINWNALTKEEHDEDEGEEHPPFDEKTIKRAITKGLDPSNQRLKSLMPRWEMNETELDAVISFLKKLD